MIIVLVNIKKNVGYKKMINKKRAITENSYTI